MALKKLLIDTELYNEEEVLSGEVDVIVYAPRTDAERVRENEIVIIQFSERGYAAEITVVVDSTNSQSLADLLAICNSNPFISLVCFKLILDEGAPVCLYNSEP